MADRRSTTVRSVIAAGALALLGPVLAACSTEPTDIEELGETLEGRTWRSTAVLVEGGFDRELWPLAQGTRIVAVFENGRLRVQTGCTTKSGSTVIRTAGAVTLTGLTSTGNPCGPATEEQDQLVEDLLLEGPTVSVEDDFMTWTGRTLVIEFVDEEFEEKPE